MNTKLCAGLVALCAGVPALPAAFTAGAVAYTKRVETVLLSEPKMLASPVTRLAYAKKLKVESVQGAWVKVSEGKNSGWIFGGNLSDEKPSEAKGLDGLSLGASKTSATAAARPLTEAGEAYAKRQNLGNASGDIEWMTQQCHDLSDQELERFLEEQKKGEYQ
ncbi:MAG: hypothetical protein JWM32_1791 [Verrucomicrobia bacterium]|nr:hypothetical protein [Verrucomicrobiota bacterium]